MIRRVAPILFCFVLLSLATAEVAHVVETPDGSGISVGGEPFHVTPAEIAGLSSYDTGSELVVLWREIGDRDAAFYAVTRDGQLVGRIRPQATELLLRRARFDPISSPLDLSDSVLEPATDGKLCLVQFRTQVLASYRAELEALGATIHAYVPHQTLLVQLPREQRDRARALPFVRWIGDYHPEFRLEPILLGGLNETTGIPAQARYILQVAERGERQKGIVADRLREAGATIDLLYPEGFWLEATLSPAQLARVVTWDEIVWVDRWSPPETDMDRVRILGGANNIEMLTGWTGQGVRCEVMDGAIRQTHVDFAGLQLHGAQAGDSDHGTKCAGIVFGTGTGSATGKGMLPDAEQRYFASYQTVANRYTHTAELVSAPYNCVFQSNSWGNARTFFYTGISAQMDDIIFLNDILICQSQSNAGDQDSRPQAWAKNIVSVGGIRHYNNTDPADDAWAGGASIGPADDGRIKPDLAYYYDAIRTTDNESDTDYNNNFGGTSAATPITAGHFGIMYQMWNNDIFGVPLPVPGGTVFQNRPHAMTAKALMINTAEQYAFSGTGHDLTRVHQGFGVPNLDNLYARRDRFLIVDETDVLSNLQSIDYDVAVEPGQPELKVTLCYMDFMGTTSAMQHRINDLSLRVTSPMGVDYWGNNGLLANNYSTPGGTSNTIDTVENVFIQNPEAGQWRITVFADEVNADTHTETAAMDADFALVASPVVGCLPSCTPTSPTGLQSGNVTLPFDVAVAGNCSTADVTISWSRDGGMTTMPCTPASASPFLNPASGVMPGSYSFVWDSVADGAGMTSPENITLHLVSTDSGGPGTGNCATTSFLVNNVTPPTCSLASPPSPSFGDVPFPITTTSVTATVDVMFQFSLDGGMTWALATAAAGSPLANPASGVTPGASSFVWDSIADGAATTMPETGVLLEAVVTSSSLTPGACMTSPFTLNNVPAPTCTLSTPASPAVGDVSFTVTSSSLDLSVDLVFEFSLSGGATWSAATPAASSPIGNPATGVPTGATTFTWDSVADGIATTLPAPGVLLRANVADGLSLSSSSCTSGAFEVNNVPAPTCTVRTPGSAATGSLKLGFTASSVAAAADLVFEYSLDAGATWNPSTAAASSTTANPAVGVPVGHGSFTWDTVADSVGTTSPATGVLVRSAIMDGLALSGGTCMTAPFEVNNVPAPACTLSTPTSPATEDVSFNLTTVSLAAAVDLAFHYSIDGGATWTTATAAASSALANPAVGVAPGPASFTWDSVADGVATAAPEGAVLLRATVTDLSLTPGTCASSPFAVDNSALCQGICGDCNLSGSAPDVLDGLLGAQFAAGIGTPTTAQMGCCDIDADGDIDVLDSLGMAQAAAGIPVTLVCP